MRLRLSSLLISIGIVTLSIPTWAQQSGPPVTAPAAGPAATPAPANVRPAPALTAPPPTANVPHKQGPPEARVGFQMHFVPLTGVQFPFGSASGERGDALSARYGWQWVPLELGLGAKIVEPLYIGGYFNVGVGYEGDDRRTEAHCEAGNDVVDDVSCSSASVHAGLEVRYTFTPAEVLSGWVGYGFGVTTASQTISDAGHYSETSTASGLELARLTGGLDVRVSRGFGFGPYILVSLGRYTHRRTEINDVVTFSGSIDNPTLHTWAGVGLRMVIFP